MLDLIESLPDINDLDNRTTSIFGILQLATPLKATKLDAPMRQLGE